MPSSRLMVGLVAPVLALGLLTFGWTPRSAAYHPVPEAHAYQGWFAGRPQVSTPGTLNDAQGAVAPGAVVGLELAPTPTPTATLGTASDSEWSLVVDGLVQFPLNLTFDDLVAMPRSTVGAKLYCVYLPTTPIDAGYWTGVRLGLLLEQAGVSQEAIKVAFYADDGFTTDLTVTTAMRNDIIVAYEKDGQPLTEGLRLVVPGKWGYKWISGLTRIVLVDYDFLGYYERHGFSDEANIPGYTPPVGGIAELPDVAATPLEAPGASGGDAGSIAGVAAVVAVGVAALAGGAWWYARRRWLR
jgi:DMSO/TMAO reductase YedYZ molybdopterin-dependent catalytic subunit